MKSGRRFGMLRKVCAVAVASVLAAGCLTACGSSKNTGPLTLDQIKENGKLTVATEAAYEPFEYMEKATTEASTTEKADTSTQTTVTISSGMSSEAIASALANAGLVDDASKFNSFLVANGYDMKLETGNFSLETGMSYEEIAKILTTKQ